jgi:dihydrofolate reductase
MTKGLNKVFIAASIDGYIADASGKVDFLDAYPHTEGEDMGYQDFITGVDAILMGRKSFETVLGFGIEWPYPKMVFVWSNTLEKVPDELETKVRLVKGNVFEVLERIRKEGYMHLYIDGGQVIQSFLKEDLIHEMTITTVPMLLGSGVPLFGSLNRWLSFNCVRSKRYKNGLVQSVYVRVAGSGTSPSS